ncbi:MAG TPA: RDD family protein [Rhabdochlamydiaceae bacterium]|jgi:hypothetical protein
MLFKNYIFKESFKGLRLFARITDYCLFYACLAFSISCLPYFLGVYFYLGLICSVPFLWIPFEALLLKRYGTTPGKSLFGIRVHTEIGGNLSFIDALRRAAFIHPRPGYITQVRLKRARKCLSYVLAALCIAVALFGKPLTYYTIGLDPKHSRNDWTQYYSLTRGFSVSFPNEPQEESKQLEIPDAGKVLNYEEISTQHTKDVLYSVSYMELPSKWRWAGSNTLLKGALDLLVKYSPEQLEVLDREIILYQNHRALDFHLKQNDNEVKGRFILVDNTLYKLTVVYPASLHEEIQEGHPFLDSFDLHPKGVNANL